MPLQHNGRIMAKRIHVRIEHVKPSRCKEEFLKRSKENDEIKHEAKQRGGEFTPRLCLYSVAVLFVVRHDELQAHDISTAAVRMGSSYSIQQSKTET